MNNGVNNTNTTNNTENNTLAPMAGVRIAPAEEGPVNASGNQTATQPSAVLQPAQPQVQVAAPQPVIAPTAPVAQPQPQQPAPTPEPIVSRLDMSIRPAQQPQEPVVEETPQTQTEQVPPTTEAPKKQLNLSVILIVLLVALGGYTFYATNNYKNQINNMRYNCTPVNTGKEVELDVNSTLVKDLYSKVETNIREDLADPNFDDSMRLYLAYRQVKEKDKYDSNCNLFSGTAMEPYKCEASFVPKAFKIDTLKEEIKKLYGEDTNIPLTNIQLGRTCIVGYQYIENRGEYVEGRCTQQTATSFSVDKTVTKATSTKNTIIITEEVKYHENEKMQLPSTLVSGTYKYTFRLDKNYNYVLVSKEYVNKY